MTAKLFDDRGRRYDLGREIGRGGEGYVCEVEGNPQRVAKVYHHPLPPEKLQKLTLMTQAARPSLLQIAAWPEAVLHDGPRGPARGILMPRVTDPREVHQLYGLGDRRKHFPKADWAFLTHVAMNLAAAIGEVHNQGHVVGDLNERGVLVNPSGTVHLIDCDSFQFRHNGTMYRCEVGVPLRTPPELHEQDLSAVVRTPNHDSFGLALLVFQLLFLGRNPFAGRYRGSGEMQPEEAIKRGLFAYSSRAAQLRMEPPPHAPDLSIVPARLAAYFEQAFTARARPTAEDFRSALHDLRHSLTTCKLEPSHKYHRGLGQCPWCRLQDVSGVAFFTSTQISWEFDSPIDLDGLWNRLQGHAKEIRDVGTRQLPPPPKLTAERIPDEARYWQITVDTTAPEIPVLHCEQMPDLPDPYVAGASMPPPAKLLELEPTLDPFVPKQAPPFHYEDPPLPAAPRRPVEPVAIAMQQANADWQQLTRGTRRSALTRALFLLGVLCLPAAGNPSVFAFAVVATLSLGLLWLIRYVPSLARASRVVSDAEIKHAVALSAHRLELKKYERLAAAHQRELNLHRQLRQEAEEDYAREVEAVRQEDLGRLEEWRKHEKEVRKQIETVRARNARRIAAWREEQAKHDQTRLAEWQRSYDAIVAERERIRQRNAKLQATYDEQVKERTRRLQEIASQEQRRRDARSAFAREKQRREAVLKAAEQTLSSLADGWRQDHADIVRRLDGATVSFHRARQDYQQLRHAFDQEKGQLRANERPNQLDDYLSQFKVRDATLKNIGDGRKATLLSYNIITAADVRDQDLDQVAGFGFALKSVLREWRKSLEAGFVFQPTKTAGLGHLAVLHARVQGPRARHRSGIFNAVEESERLRHEASDAWKRYLDSVPQEVWQARTDYQQMLRMEQWYP